MRILYFGVFDGRRWRAEYPMLAALQALGHQITTVNFRSLFKWQIGAALQKQDRVDLVFLQNGIPFKEAYLQQIQKPFVFLASEFAVDSARHILESRRPPDLVLAHSQQTYDYCLKRGIRAKRIHLAYNDQIYTPLPDLPWRYDFCFIGGLNARREEWLKPLQKQAYKSFVGTVHQPEKINRIYNQSRLILHVHAANQHYLPVRLFEVLPTRGCLLIESLGDNADPSLGQDFYASFATPTELQQKLDHLLSHEAERAQRVQVANQLAPQHSWSARMEEFAADFATLL